MARGMGCFAHPEEQGVAQCKRCGRAMCKECSDRCIKSNEKYVGLCKDCVVQVGIECDYHPSRQAVTQCQRCNKFLCSSCYDDAWLNASISEGTKTLCHSCMGDWVLSATKTMDDFREEQKKNWSLVAVFSTVGLIIGLIIGLTDGIGKGRDASQIVGEIIAYMWIGIGIGCSVRGFLSILHFVFFVHIIDCIKNKGLIDGLKAWLMEGLVGGFILGIVFCIIGMFTGPIIPLCYILIRRGHIKKVGAMIESNTDILKTLQDAHTTQNDSATQLAIHQGADIFVKNEEKMKRFDKPIPILGWLGLY